jgi:hypothetical protein
MASRIALKALKNLIPFGKSRGKPAAPNSFATIDEARAPNVKQYLRGLRNYYILSAHIKVDKLG